MECTVDGLLFVSNFDSGNLAQVEKTVRVDEDGTKQPSPVASGGYKNCLIC